MVMVLILLNTVFQLSQQKGVLSFLVKKGSYYKTTTQEGRISITFRKMDDSKMPYRFLLDPELDGINPLDYSLANHQKVHYNDKSTRREYEPVRTRSNNSFVIEKDDFPPLGSS